MVRYSANKAENYSLRNVHTVFNIYLTERLRLFSSVEFLLDPQVVNVTRPEVIRGKLPKPSTEKYNRWSKLIN